ncbi:flavin reductase family protein [Leifsonia sp. NPDC056824]|uniref:flavin reductase family protein n=1 Tax=Leifsonia sp. NPDC056824 TaxID=3345953 RepID=UPI003690409F
MTRAEHSRTHRVVRPPILYAGTPVILLSSLNGDGSPNLAPASSYWALGQMLALGLETEGQTLANLQERPQLTVSFPSPPLWPAVERIAELTGRAEVPAAKAGRYTHHADKFAAAGLTPQASDLVGPPRVAECLLQLEAEVRRITPGVTGEYAIAEAEVVRVHADRRIIADGDHIDPLAWEPIVYSFRHYFGIGEPLGARGGATPADEDAESGSGFDVDAWELWEAGGDSACWLASVCPECGAMRDGDDDGPCPRCDADPPD